MTRCAHEFTRHTGWIGLSNLKSRFLQRSRLSPLLPMKPELHQSIPKHLPFRANVSFGPIQSSLSPVKHLVAMLPNSMSRSGGAEHQEGGGEV